MVSHTHTHIHTHHTHAHAHTPHTLHPVICFSFLPMFAVVDDTLLGKQPRHIPELHVLLLTNWVAVIINVQVTNIATD